MKRRTKDILKEEGALVAGGKKLWMPLRQGAKEGKPVEGTPSLRSRSRNERLSLLAAQFSPAERRFYDQLEERADKSLRR